MLIFEPLASSSAGCSYRLSGGGARNPLLIDAGIRFELIQKGLNFRISELAGCLISHGHGDHVKAVPNLLDSGLNVYASDETWQMQKPAVRDHFRAQRVYGLSTVKVGDWSVMPFDAVHDMPGTLGFYIGSPSGHKALYLTDSCYSPFKFEGLTHIYIECNFADEIIRENVARGMDVSRATRTMRTHMSIGRLLDMLKANDLSRVEEIWLLHLSSANSDEADFITQVRRLTGKPVYVAAERAAQPPF